MTTPRPGAFLDPRLSGVAVLGEAEENSAVARFDMVQELLPEALAALNQAHRARLVAPLATSGGFPEFWGVARDLAMAYVLARDLAERFHPLAVRLAAARGEVRLTAPGGDLEQLEGSAFETAGELLYRARNEDRLLLIQGGDPRLDRMGNATFQVLWRQMQTWTPRQCQVIRLYRAHGRQKRVAEDLSVTQQTVSSSLAAAGWKVLAETETAIDSVFRDG